MRLAHGLHLGYCTNIHRGEDWPQTFEALERYTLAVREQVCPNQPYGIGLRLGHTAARQLNQPEDLTAFRKWLDVNNCYVFTINGFPYGTFHGAAIKERVYLPDWSTPERLDYTNLLFNLLAQLLPEGIEGSVSTLPGCFKEHFRGAAHAQAIRQNLWRCVEHISALSERTGRRLHLGVEPEPLCLLETTPETIAFFEQMRAEQPGDRRLGEHLGVNYDACHLAVEFEEPEQAFAALHENQIRVSKIHLSSALKANPGTEARKALRSFADTTYLHQVVARSASGQLTRYKDLDLALDAPPQEAEWRIHFHVPLHTPPTRLFGNTTGDLERLFKILQTSPSLCHHVEMETYTWEVMPPELKNGTVVDQLVREYRWALAQLEEHGFPPL